MLELPRPHVKARVQTSDFHSAEACFTFVKNAYTNMNYKYDDALGQLVPRSQPLHEVKVRRQQHDGVIARYFPRVPKPKLIFE